MSEAVITVTCGDDHVAYAKYSSDGTSVESLARLLLSAYHAAEAQVWGPNILGHSPYPTINDQLATLARARGYKLVPIALDVTG